MYTLLFFLIFLVGCNNLSVSYVNHLWATAFHAVNIVIATHHLPICNVVQSFLLFLQLGNLLIINSMIYIYLFSSDSNPR